MAEHTYKIVRFYQHCPGQHDLGDPNLTGLTLEQAQAHCQDESTHGEGWFDGYTKEEG